MSLFNISVCQILREINSVRKNQAGLKLCQFGMYYLDFKKSKICMYTQNFFNDCNNFTKKTSATTLDTFYEVNLMFTL